jgi:RNA polymerase sigma factor (sigma-70 family)
VSRARVVSSTARVSRAEAPRVDAKVFCTAAQDAPPPEYRLAPSAGRSSRQPRSDGEHPAPPRGIKRPEKLRRSTAQRGLLLGPHLSFRRDSRGRVVQSSLRLLFRRVTDDPATRDCPDEELLLRFVADRDEAAFEAIVRRHGPMVLDVCRAVLGNVADAEDAFQAAFLVLVRKAGSVQKAASLASWLHGVARHTALKARASSVRHERRGGARPECGVTDPDNLTWDELRRVMHEELGQLPERFREPLVLCFLEGNTQDEAAARLRLSKGTLKRRLEQGRALLRERLVRRGVGPAGVLLAAVWPTAEATALPPAVVSSTVKAATAVAAGSAAARAISAEVAALTERVLTAMFLTRLKAVTAGVLFALVTVLGLALAGHAAATGLGGEARPVEPEPLPGDERKPSPKVVGGASWKARATLKGHTDEVLCLTFGVDQLATAGKDGTIRVWDTTTGKEQHQCGYSSEDGLMKHVAFTPDGKHVLMNFGDQIGYWDVAQKNFPKGAIGGASPIGVASGPDGHSVLLHRKERNKDVSIMQVPRFGAVGDDKDILGFGAGSEDVGLFSHPGVVNGAALSEDGAVLGVATADKTIHLWAVATKKEQSVCKGHADVILALAFSPDGKTLASAGKDGTVRLWEVATGKELALLKGHEGAVHSAAFSPDGKTLASGGDDMIVAVWDVTGKKRQAVLEGHTGAVLHVAFSRDGKVLASASKDKAVRLWEPAK